MNGDLAFTISDVWLLIKFFWLLPSNIVLWAIETPEVSPMLELETFFEITCASGNGWGAAIVSPFGWLMAVALIVGAYMNIVGAYIGIKEKLGALWEWLIHDLR